MKLPNNYGGIVKLSGKRRRPYMARKTIGYDDKGHQKFYIIGYFESQGEALDALVEFNKKNITDFTGIKRQDISFGDLYKEWYTRQSLLVEQGDLSESSLEGYRTAWKHLKELKDAKVKNFRKSDMQKIIDDLYQGNYSKSAITKVKALSGVLLDYAIGDKIIDTNYAKLCKIPTTKQANKQSLEDNDILRIERLAKKDKWAETLMILIYTGMRPGEMLALTKDNIDIDNMLIIGGAKTDAGKDRIIPIHPKIQSILKRRYEDINSGAIIEVNGKTLKNKVDNYRKNYFNPLKAKLKLNDDVTPYTCRHTFGTLMNKSDADMVAIKNIIGHSNYATTANIYTHPDVETLRKEIEKI